MPKASNGSSVAAPPSNQACRGGFLSAVPWQEAGVLDPGTQNAAAGEDLAAALVELPDAEMLVQS